MSEYDPLNDSDTRALHDAACPGCGWEPEVVTYWRDIATKRRVGYTCTCGFRVIHGTVHGINVG